VGVFFLSSTGAQSPKVNAPPPVSTNITRLNLPAEQAAVWNAVDKQWGRSGCCGREDLWGAQIKWLDLLADGAEVWYWNQPAPINKESIRMWADATQRPEKPWARKRVAYELYPQGLVIHGNTAVAHYRYTDSELTADGKLETTQGRYTDILVRERPGAQWMLLSWVGGGLKE
jgi:hypothetical protein